MRFVFDVISRDLLPCERCDLYCITQLVYPTLTLSHGLDYICITVSVTVTRVSLTLALGEAGLPSRL